jgi:hypothetical protein
LRCRQYLYLLFRQLICLTLALHGPAERTFTMISGRWSPSTSASTNKACREKSSLVLGRRCIIKPYAEAASRASLKISLCNHSSLPFREFELRDEPARLRGIQRDGCYQDDRECKERLHVLSPRKTTACRALMVPYMKQIDDSPQNIRDRDLNPRISQRWQEFR